MNYFPETDMNFSTLLSNMKTDITQHTNRQSDGINAKLAVFPLIIAALCSMAVAAVTVIESTPTRVVLAWELTGFDTASVDGGSGLETHVSFDGGYALVGDAGAPFIPGFSIHFGLPPSGTPRVTVQPEEMTVVRIANPLHKRDFPADPADPVFVSRWISEPAYEHMRGNRVGRVVLRPVIEAGPGRLRLLQRARIVIDIPAVPHTGASWAPRDDFERMARRLLVNFNTAQGWQERRGLRRIAEAPTPQEAFPFSIGQRLASFKVGDGNEGTTEENSLIRISGRKIIEIFGPNVPINSVALYASIRGEMTDSVPTMGQIPPGVFEVPILRYGNGIVDTSDYIIAYVGGASDWAYSAEGRQFTFSINRYDDYRTYWLTVKSGGENGLAMQNFTGPNAGSSSTLYETFVDNVYIRTPRVLNHRANEGGIDWTWRIFTVAHSDTTMRLDLPGIVKNMSGSMRLINGLDSNWGEGGISHMAAFLGSNRLCESCRDAWVDIGSWDSDELTLRYTQTALSPRARRELNAIHLRYPRSLGISNDSDKLEIFSSTTDGAARYELTIDGGPAYIVRVPMDERSISLVGKVDGPSHTWSDDGNLGVRYMAMLESAVIDYSDSLREFTRRPVDGRYQTYHIHNRDLRNTSNETDYLIITHEDFTDAAQRLAEHKTNMGFSSPKVVELGDILAQFGGGNTDPTAIRNFLLYVYRYWRGGDAFSYVVLFGAGHYDYKHVISRAVNFMPIPYIHHTLRRINDLSDDYYTFFDTLRHPSVQHNGYYYIGRLPAKSLTEASDIVDKIIEMEDPRFADFGPWRNRFLMVADDDQQGARRDATPHYLSTERISRTLVRDRPDIDLRKLYLFEYPWDDRYQKPGAARSFINELNNGVAVMNFFGHGNPSQLTDERIFASADITALYNRRQYPVFTIFSCSVGKFDWPNMDSMAELLVKQPRAGAGAVISAAREVFAGRNELLAVPFFEALFDPEENASLSIGAALRYAKHRYTTTGASDNRYYVILGDPSMRLYERARNINLTITNADGNEIDTLKAMQQITISGTVQNMQGQHDGNFGGGNAFVNITLFNPPQDSVLRKDGGIFTTPVYMLPGTPVFSASIPVANGEFKQQLLLPMNLVFGKSGVKLTAYAWKTGDPTTGTGIIDSLIFDGSEAGGIGDMTGPRISVRPVFTDANAAHMNQAGLFVRNRVTAQLPLTLEINIESENGVNTIGTGPDEGLTAEISGALSKRSINHLFQFSPGSFRQGIATLTYDEKELRSGTHELIISAQDLIGNVSKLSVALDIVDPSELKLDHVINVPNPVRMGRETRFFYHHSDNPGNLDVNVTIRIYSLGGRLLAVIRNPHNGYTWIPKDERGNLLTPNVYLYQVTATSPNIGRTVRSKIKKLVVHPPR
jgi:hypothetical protein